MRTRASFLVERCNADEPSNLQVDSISASDSIAGQRRVGTDLEKSGSPELRNLNCELNMEPEDSEDCVHEALLRSPNSESLLTAAVSIERTYAPPSFKLLSPPSNFSLADVH